VFYYLFSFLILFFYRHLFSSFFCSYFFSRDFISNLPNLLRNKKTSAPVWFFFCRTRAPVWFPVSVEQNLATCMHIGSVCFDRMFQPVCTCSQHAPATIRLPRLNMCVCDYQELTISLPNNEYQVGSSRRSHTYFNSRSHTKYTYIYQGHTHNRTSGHTPHFKFRTYKFQSPTVQCKLKFLNHSNALTNLKTSILLLLSSSTACATPRPPRFLRSMYTGCEP
jgi:hypothetical protein